MVLNAVKMLDYFLRETVKRKLFPDLKIKKYVITFVMLKNIGKCFSEIFYT